MQIQYQAFGATSIAVGLVFTFGSMPFWWLGAGLVAAGIALLIWVQRDELGDWLERLREPRTLFGIEFVPATLAAEVLCLAVIAGLTTAMMPNVALGDRPTNHDHTVHFFKAWQLEKEFLAQGHVYGWSHRWFGGYPAQYLYPIGGDLLVVAVHALTLGFADLGTAYAWAIWLFWFVSGYAVYRFGTLGFGRWVGLLAAILFITDTAANRIGGWYFAMKWGVWPMSLATVLGVWAMARAPRLMEGDRWRDVAVFGVLFAAALITHPFSLIHLGLAVVLALFAYWIADRDRHWLAGVSRLGAGIGVGGLLACIWLVPFMASQSEMDPGFGGTWASLLSIGRGFYNLNFLPGTWSMATAFGIVGIFALMWSRTFEHLLIGMISVVFIVFGSTDFVGAFNLLDYVSSFERIHFKRFITLLKPYFMVAAAYGLVAIVRSTIEQGFRRGRESEDGEDEERAALQPTARLAFQTFLFFTCLTPLVVPFAELYGANQVKRDLKTASERPHQSARRQLAAWFREKFPEGEPFFRVGMSLYEHDHRFVDWARHIPFPTYKMGYTPATAFQYRFESNSEKALKATNVRYVLTLNAPPPGDFRKVEQFGAIGLYEYEDWQEEPFEIVDGEGPVELKHWGDERIELRAGEGAHGTLRLNVSRFSNWTAYRDGEEVSIGATDLGFEEPSGFMTVELQPGTYRFVFERGWAEPAAFLLFLIGVVFAVAFLLADTSTGVGRRVRGWLETAAEAVAGFTRRRTRSLDAIGAAAVLGVVLVACWMAWSWPPLDTRNSDLGAEVEDVHFDFGDQLRDATVRVRKSGGQSQICKPMLGRFFCGRPAWKVVQQRVDDFGMELLVERCIWAHPLRKGDIEIAFGDVPTGDAVVGFYGVPESGRSSRSKPVEFEVGVDGVSMFTGEAPRSEYLGTFRIPLDERQGSGPMDVSFRVSASNVGKRHFCFNAQVVDMKSGWAPSTESEAPKE